MEYLLKVSPDWLFTRFGDEVLNYLDARIEGHLRTNFLELLYNP